jgi:hypothetical protein
VLAYSGSRASPVDQSAFSTVNTPTLAAQPGSITPTANNELLVTARNIYGSAGTLTVDSGFTIQDFTDGVNNVNVGLGVATLVQPTAAAINPTWTRGSFPSGGDILVITSFFG